MRVVKGSDRDSNRHLRTIDVHNPRGPARNLIDGLPEKFQTTTYNWQFLEINAFGVMQIKAYIILAWEYKPFQLSSLDLKICQNFLLLSI